MSSCCCKNEVFPACSPRLLDTGPPLRTPDDLRRHALIHDQAVERDPLAPTWPMWLKAAGVKDIPATAGLTFNSMASWRSTRRSPATASCSPTARSPPPTSPPDAWCGCSRSALPDLFAYYIVTAPGALERPKVRAFRNWLRQEADAGGGVSAGSGGSR